MQVIFLILLIPLGFVYKKLQVLSFKLQFVFFIPYLFSVMQNLIQPNWLASFFVLSCVIEYLMMMVPSFIWKYESLSVYW